MSMEILDELIPIGELKFQRKDFLKCPFNYIGGKYKLLPQLFTVFPENSDIFLDVFGGGFNVGINSDASRIIYNDNVKPLVDIFRYFRDNSKQDIMNYIDSTIKENNLGKFNKPEYYSFRDRYNEGVDRHPLDLYVLICFSFNNQIRFNRNGKFNMPSGFGRSYFTDSMRMRLMRCVDVIHEKDVVFLDGNFSDLDCSCLSGDSFVYCDPPYLITEATYNVGWSLDEECRLLDFLSGLDRDGVRFALSNVIVHDGRCNDLLIDWIGENGFAVFGLDSDYSNCSYHKRNRGVGGSVECLVVNY